MSANFKARNLHCIPEKKIADLVLMATADASLVRKWTPMLQDAFGIDAVSEWGELERLTRSKRPAIVLLDSDMIHMNGGSDFSRVRRLTHISKVIVFSGMQDDREALLALKAGARGYSSKSIEVSLLGTAVDVVGKGGIWLQPKNISCLMSDMAGESQIHERDRPPLNESQVRIILTPREHQICRLIAEEGASNKEISTRLSISERTVKAHLTSIFQKLQISDRLHLALFFNSCRQSSQH